MMTHNNKIWAWSCDFEMCVWQELLSHTTSLLPGPYTEKVFDATLKKIDKTKNILIAFAFTS